MTDDDHWVFLFLSIRIIFFSVAVLCVTKEKKKLKPPGMQLNEQSNIIRPRAVAQQPLAATGKLLTAQLAFQESKSGGACSKGPIPSLKVDDMLQYLLSMFQDVPDLTPKGRVHGAMADGDGEDWEDDEEDEEDQ